MTRTKALVLCGSAVIGLLLPAAACAGDVVPAPPTGYTAFGYAHGPGYPLGYIGYNGYFGEPALYSSYNGDGSCYLAQHRVRTRRGSHIHLTQVCG